MIYLIKKDELQAEIHKQILIVVRKLRIKSPPPSFPIKIPLNYKHKQLLLRV